MERPKRTRRIRFKSIKCEANVEQKNETNDEFAEEFRYSDSDDALSDSTSSEDEHQSLSFPGNRVHKHNVDLCQDVYLRSCRHFGTVPSTYFFRRLKKQHIDMSHHCVGSIGIKTVAIALVGNTTVQKLNLSSNDVGYEGLKHVMQLMEENFVITDLNLSNNNLLSDGAEMLSKSLAKNKTITKLDISANGFSEYDAVFISNMITGNSPDNIFLGFRNPLVTIARARWTRAKKNTHLKTLIVSKNKFQEEGGVSLANALECNKTLKHLDLSWNHLRQKGAVALCFCLQTNDCLETLNLEWNGFGMEGCHEMGKALLKNRSLRELNLSSNRVSLDAFRQLLQGVGKNKTLKILRVGFNPITTDGAIAILRSIIISDSALEEIDLTDVSVDESFVDLLAEIKEQRELRVIHGIVLRHDEITKGPRRTVLDTDDPVAILFEYMKQKNLRLIDLLHNLDRDHSDTLTREEFQRGMTSIDLPLSSRALDTLMKKLDINEDGEVDYEELTIKHKEYQRRVTKLKMQANEGAKFYKGFDKLEQLREAVRLRIALNMGGEGQR